MSVAVKITAATLYQALIKAPQQRKATEQPLISTQCDLPLSAFLPESVFFKWLTAGPIKCNMTEAASNTYQARLLYYFKYL